MLKIRECRRTVGSNDVSSVKDGSRGMKLKEKLLVKVGKFSCYSNLAKYRFIYNEVLGSVMQLRFCL